jgi:hypothetical protein
MTVSGFCYRHGCSKLAEARALFDTPDGKKNRPVCEEHIEETERIGCFVKWSEDPSDLAEYSMEAKNGT